MFRHNVGGVDRVLRLTLGGILFLAGLLLLASKIRPGSILAVVGILALLTGIVRFCALYIPFGISTAHPGRPPRNQVCDCAAWMKSMQDNRAEFTPAGSPKEKSSEVVTAASRR
jgi:Inner membrane protein YgaP-like, transmembrane domain